MEVEDVSRVGLTPRGTPEQEGHLTVGHSLEQQDRREGQSECVRDRFYTPALRDRRR